MAPRYKNIHIVINPASGKNEPILNVLNDVFKDYDVDWNISITRKFGDAKAFARQAALDGADLVAGYGGDGTQHEIANGVLGTDATMGVLPGGTGNGFCTELGLPKTLREATEVLCTSDNTRDIDVVQMGDEFVIQRLYVGIEPEDQTSREDKDKYGTMAYAITAIQRAKKSQEIPYKVTIDDEVIEMPAMKLYVVNAAQSGTGISVTGGLSLPDDGLVDVFVLNTSNFETITAHVDRMLKRDVPLAQKYFWRGKNITIDTDPDQPVWADGEYMGRTPVTLTVLPGALRIAVV